MWVRVTLNGVGGCSSGDFVHLWSFSECVINGQVVCWLFLSFLKNLSKNHLTGALEWVSWGALSRCTSMHLHVNRDAGWIMIACSDFRR